MKPTNLSEYYQSIGQALPTVAQRQGIAQEAGISGYTGTASQNAVLLSYLQNQGSTNQSNTQRTSIGNEINLGNIDTNLPVPNIPTFQIPEFTKEGLLDQRGNLERDTFDLEQELRNQEQRRLDLMAQRGISDEDIVRANDELRAAQDRDIEIPIEAKQQLRGKGATMTEFSQTTTPRLEDNLLRTLAASRTAASFNDTVNQIEKTLDRERQTNALIYQQKMSRLNQIETLYSSFLDRESKERLELAKMGADIEKTKMDNFNKFQTTLFNEAVKNGDHETIAKLANVEPGDYQGLLGIIGEQAASKNAQAAADAQERQNEIIGRSKSIITQINDLLGMKGLEGAVGIGFLSRGLNIGNVTEFITKMDGIIAQLGQEELGRMKDRLGSVSQLANSEGEREMLNDAIIYLGDREKGKKVKMSEDTFKVLFQGIQEKYALDVIQSSMTPDQYSSGTWESRSYNEIMGKYEKILENRGVSTQSPANQDFGFNSVGNDTNAVSLIKQFEGFSPTAYRDGNGYSIGYGNQTHPDGTPVRAGDVISPSQADQYLATAINSHSNWKNLINVPLTPNQQAALASFEYNLGSGIWNGAQAKQIIASINSGNFMNAANLMQQFNKSQGKTLAALVDRRRQEGQLLLT